jgi:hypothetical protein
MSFLSFSFKLIFDTCPKKETRQTCLPILWTKKDLFHEVVGKSGQNKEHCWIPMFHAGLVN